MASLTDTEVAALREQALVIVREYAEDKTRNDGTVRWNDTSAIMAEEQLQLIERIEAEKERAERLDRLRRTNGELRLERTRELSSTEDELERVRLERDANMESREKMAEALRQCIVERDQLRADFAGKRAAESPGHGASIDEAALQAKLDDALAAFRVANREAVAQAEVAESLSMHLGRIGDFVGYAAGDDDILAAVMRVVGDLRAKLNAAAIRAGATSNG